MKRLLVLSSYVSTSRVGGVLALLAGPALGVEPILIPTTVLGRHPGLGAPGGGAVSDNMFNSMIEGAEANGALESDAILTGYFASPNQVKAAAALIDRMRVANPEVQVIIDPIMGDDGRGLYIREDTALALASDLAPRADIITPNMWEFSRLWGTSSDAPIAAVISAARQCAGRPVLVSSIRIDDMQIGALYCDEETAWVAIGALIRGKIPNGTGDLLTLAFASSLMLGVAPGPALKRGIGLTHALIKQSVASSAIDLPIVAARDLIAAPPEGRLLRLE